MYSTKSHLYGVSQLDQICIKQHVMDIFLTSQSGRVVTLQWYAAVLLGNP